MAMPTAPRPAAGPHPAVPAGSTQNSLPSGSASTTPRPPLTESTRPRPSQAAGRPRRRGRRRPGRELPAARGSGPVFGVQRGPTPGDLGATAGRPDRSLLVLVPDQRPAQRRAPEVPTRWPEPSPDRAPMKPQSGPGTCCPPRSRRTRCPPGRRARRAPPRAAGPCRGGRPPRASARATVSCCCSGDALVEVEVELVRADLRLVGRGNRSRKPVLVRRATAPRRPSGVLDLPAQHPGPEPGEPPGRSRRRTAPPAHTSSVVPRSARSRPPTLGRPGCAAPLLSAATRRPAGAG